VDIVGSTVKDDAEILAITNKIFKKLGVSIKIFVGNRKIIQGVLELVFGIKDKEQIKDMIRYLDKLDKKKPKEIIKEMEANAKKNIKILQMKNIFIPFLNTLKNLDLEKLKDYCMGILKKRKEEDSYDASLFKQGYDEVKELIKYSKFYKVKFDFLGYLARGLSYYNGNVFEIKSSSMRETICAGGAYQINDTQATGISFGIDRIASVSKVEANDVKTLVISIEQDREAIKLAERLREQGKNVTIYYGKPSKALEFANSKGIEEVIFVGKEEVTSGKFKIKDMASGGTRQLKI
jgi:histidyl-tRNA synthetase